MQSGVPFDVATCMYYTGGDHYHAVANPAKGEPAGEGGLPKQGYRPGRKTQRR